MGTEDPECSESVASDEFSQAALAAGVEALDRNRNLGDHTDIVRGIVRAVLNHAESYVIVTEAMKEKGVIILGEYRIGDQNLEELVDQIYSVMEYGRRSLIGK